VAVGESETMRVGRALMTTSPLAAWIVIGNAALRADDDCAATRGDREGGKSHHDNERTAKHESSFREGFGVRGERQVF